MSKATRAWRNDAARYGTISIVLHWSVALAVSAMLATAGWAWVAPNATLAGDRIALHVATGAVAWPLIAVRIAWHFLERQPASLAEAPFARVAQIVHAALLVMIAAQLLSGPLANWAGGWPIDVFGWFALPSPFGDALKPWSEAIGAVHRFTGYGVAALVTLHVAAATKHLTIDCDETVPRMLGYDAPPAR